MGDVIPFTYNRTSFDLRKVPRQLDDIHQGIAANAALFREMRDHFRSAEKHARHVVATLDRCREVLDWTGRFCNRCRQAMDLQDLDEMVRQRDELAEVMKRQETSDQPWWSVASAGTRWGSRMPQSIDLNQRPTVPEGAL